VLLFIAQFEPIQTGNSILKARDDMVQDLTPIHPDLRERAKKFPNLPYNPWSVRLIQWLMPLAPAPKISDTIEISHEYAQSADSKHSVMLRVYKPKAATTPLPVLMWMHGGGLVIGNTKMDDIYVSKFITELGIAVVSVEYRLAPGNPYPAAIEDCYSALKWIHAHAKTLGIDPDRIAIGGESAGGGLTASLAQMAHDRGAVKPVFQLLIYPMLDDRSSLRADFPHLDLMTWTPKGNRFAWECYLKQAVGLDTVPPYAVPARREDLTGLPPAWIGVGTLDLFYDENIAYAENLKQCGVDCEVMAIEGAFHGFDVFHDPVAPVQDFRNAQVAALKKHLFPD
jgi:acetyl esterase/lipase